MLNMHSLGSVDDYKPVLLRPPLNPVWTAFLLSGVLQPEASAKFKSQSSSLVQAKCNLLSARHLVLKLYLI
jgi:hypothetical protein